MLAFHQSLRAIFESIRQRIGANVAHRQLLALFFEDEIHSSVHVGDRASTHISGDPHALVQRCALQRGKLGNGVVVRLALSEAYVGQSQQRNYNDPGSDKKFMPSIHVNAPTRS